MPASLSISRHTLGRSRFSVDIPLGVREGLCGRAPTPTQSLLPGSTRASNKGTKPLPMSSASIAYPIYAQVAPLSICFYALTCWQPSRPRCARVPGKIITYATKGLLPSDRGFHVPSLVGSRRVRGAHEFQARSSHTPQRACCQVIEASMCPHLLAAVASEVRTSSRRLA